uniref:UPF0434 protein BECKFM1743A_GA0114220_104372 n=1 Tax=Candidatus Kentrum sp. FM TaxID=2126340 RepID=A0A450WCR8_9GAMM|nr:MAG: hypothetical protein BECKFM1743C_GA0114222_100878 [Candidatus Kentron sp. FM]VFJ67112.1 MAG: hypothetical protein BECKFM1743A_GA0114220_104372 [Candidatus Kentron sp. FM]VFK14866.1 MAG: hypothetical protein BECKFM1743B_GA0114221_103432 [Candidatus Kentron sp. FM]
MLDKKLLEIIVCPVCKGPLVNRLDEDINQMELICRPCQLGYPVRDDIPVMLEDEARQLTVEECA